MCSGLTVAVAASWKLRKFSACKSIAIYLLSIGQVHHTHTQVLRKTQVTADTLPHTCRDCAINLGYQLDQSYASCALQPYEVPCIDWEYVEYWLAKINTHLPTQTVGPRGGKYTQWAKNNCQPPTSWLTGREPQWTAMNPFQLSLRSRD